MSHLLDHVIDTFADSPAGVVDNSGLYRAVARRASLSDDEMDKAKPIGQAASPRSPLKRECRWHQQTLKQLGLIERVPEQRGSWRLTEEGRLKLKLRKAEPGFAMLGFSTKLGIAIWGTSHRVFSNINEPIHLYLSSPPYPLRVPRAYGNPPATEYVDFICSTLEPIVKNLSPGGSIVLNVSNDIFLPGSPARSTYRERMVIALEDRLGLYKMDELIWESNKAPGPIAWASKTRYQLNVGYEPVYWFCNDPLRCIANNQRVLQPHTETHQKYIDAGGERRTADYSDGAYSLRPGRFANKTAGRIPRNVLHYSNVCADQRKYKKQCSALGLPPHGAPMPRNIIRFLIQFLTEKGNLVADSMAGSLSVATESEDLERRWIVCDQIYEYVRGGAERFTKADGFAMGNDFDALRLQSTVPDFA
jgi:site-specific DNA-methyltransferase (cytosine-N4-specific)